MRRSMHSCISSEDLEGQTVTMSTLMQLLSVGDIFRIKVSLLNIELSVENFILNPSLDTHIHILAILICASSKSVFYFFQIYKVNM